MQRRYLAAAVAERFPGFADVEYPDWRSFFGRLADAAAHAGWRGPFILDELPYLIAADPSVAGVLQNWLDGQGRRPCVVVSGSSRHMMHGAVLSADAPLYGRAVEAFAVRPLRPGYLADVFTAEPPRALVYLRPQEMFARAYAQWVALKSGDRRMLDQLDARLADEDNLRIVLSQWPAAEFLPIARALDTLFERQGWVTERS